MSFNLKLVVIGFILLSQFSCNREDKTDTTWHYSKDDIIDAGAGTVNTDKLNVDVYLDATTSMKGFVSPAATNFSRLLDDIEATCQNVWKNTDMRYYKFGRTVDSVSRAEFVSGKTSTGIYSDPRLSTQTNFAEAVKNTDPKRVSIIITDLFYNNSDVNLVVNAIKTECFQKGVEAGLIGLTSPFNGIVADVQPPVTVNGERPLYVLVFGQRQNINLLFNTLKNKPYIKGNQLLLVTNRPAEGYEVNVTKDKKNRTINKQSLPKALKDYGTVFNFRMKAEDNEALLNMELSPRLNPYITPFTEKNIKALAFSKTPGAKDSVPANDQLVMQNLKYTGNKLTADFVLTNTGKEGKYTYLVYLTFDNTIPLPMPQWVKQNSTDTYAQNINEQKTLNLEQLLTGITTNHITYAQPKIAKFYICVEKRN